MDDANQLTGEERDKTYGQIATDLAKGPAPWASRSTGTNIDFFGPEDRLPGEPGLVWVRPEHLLHPLIVERVWSR